MVQTTETLGEELASRTAEFGAIESDDVRSQKRVIDATARDLNRFAERLATETPLMSRSLTQGLQAWSSAATILHEDFDTDDLQVIESAVDQVSEMRETTEGAMVAIRGLRESVSWYPRMTARFNRAKRAALESFDQILHVFDNACTEMLGVEETFRTILQDADGLAAYE
jgi:hypothetical protein